MAKKMLTSGRVIATEKKKNKAERADRTTVNVRGNRAEMGHTKKLEFHSTIDD
jgi:hypothetical protein